MTVSLTQLIYLICFVQVIIFCIFLLKHINCCRPNVFLSVFFIAQLILLGRQLVGLFFTQEVQYFVYLLSYPTFWIVVPSVLLYTQSALNPEFRISKSHLIHYLPALIIFVYSSVNTFQIILQSNGLTPLISDVINRLVEKMLAFAMYIYFLLYTLLSLKIINRYSSNNENSRNHRKQKMIKWLKLFIYSFFISWLINAVIIYAYHLNILPFLLSIAPLILILPFFLFFNIVFYYAWENPRPFTIQDERNREQFIIDTEQEKLKKKTDHLIDFVSNEKPYLDPDLSMNRFSELVGIPVKDISKAVNLLFHQNFNDFINYYRTREVIITLESSEKLDTDLVSLALDCGFNSKASFFRIFKKNTGLTPRQYFDNIQLRKQELLSEAC